jgi:predicted ester cyclase
MATTPHPLVWDFYRTVDGASNLGGVIHYYDEMSQSIYLSSGLKTDVAGVPEGHWETADWTEDIQVTQDNDISMLRFDHPSNGILYGVASNGNELTFLRYIYGMDISQIVDSWSWLSQTDNAIAQFDSAVQNIDPEIFGAESSLFQPGARIRVHIFMGDSNAYPIGTVWLDESGYGQLENTVKVSGRNTIGYYLKDQTFDDRTVFEGTVSEVLSAILEYAGLTRYVVQPLETEKKFEFKPSDTLLKGIETILDFYTTIEDKMEIVELTDGTICIGYDYWVSTYLPRNYYSFDDGREVFKRNTTRASDSAYSKLRVTGKDADGNELKAVTVDVESFRYWSLGSHRTKHLTAPDGMTQSGLQAWAEAQASILQYIGVAEDFVGPFRPQLVVGDIAEVVRGETGTSLGVITQVKQAFDKQSGFMTEFSVDSGGVATEAASTYGLGDVSVRDGAVIYSRSARVNGYNRKQSIVDLVKYTAEKAGKVDNLTASDVGAESKGTSSDLLAKHNDNPLAHPHITDKLRNIPTYSESDYGKFLSCDENGYVWTEVAASDLPSAEGVTF